MRAFNPTASPAVRDAIGAITSLLDADSGGGGRIIELYGDMEGQRAVSARTVEAYSGLSRPESKHGFVLALEIFFQTVCHLLAAAALSADRSRFLVDLQQLPSRDFARRMAEIVSGDFHRQQGVGAFSGTMEGGWLNEDMVLSLAPRLKQIVGLLLRRVEVGRFDTVDPLQSLHCAVFPANLSHSTGQFYTPPWLAEFVLDASGWRPGQRLIDPFCGSGVFLLAALARAKEAGHAASEIAPTLLGIDLSPTAACAARANLLLAYLRQGEQRIADLPINILHADALAPAIVKGQALAAVGECDEAAGERSTCADGSARRLGDYGVDLTQWTTRAADGNPRPVSDDDRHAAEQGAIRGLLPADVLVANPPWIGWEYIPRMYRDRLAPAWRAYQLFDQRGLKAAFVKEDLSTLCVPAALDTYLAAKGRAAFVLRQSTMKSDLAGRGLRRLSLFKDSEPVELAHIHDLGRLDIFEGAAAPAAVWVVNRGRRTKFPVSVSSWRSKGPRKVHTHASLEEVMQDVVIAREYCRPVSTTEPEGRWTFDRSPGADPLDAIKGASALRARIGFFTGGANAVYYLSLRWKGQPHSLYRNIVARAKRAAPCVETMLEDELVYSVLRGRDLGYWQAKPDVHVLCPHSKETRMKPIGDDEMAAKFPLAAKYLASMRDVLECRNGFAGWEKQNQQECFYTLQRIGEYSFSPYKVCWSYISDDFVVAVCGPDAEGKPVLPNDKVVFVPAATETEAYFLAGLLSFNVIRSSIISSISGRQVSANVIRQYALPQFVPEDERHQAIASACRSGHQAMAQASLSGAEACYAALNELCAALLGLSPALVGQAEKAIRDRLGYYPFRAGKTV